MYIDVVGEAHVCAVRLYPRERSSVRTHASGRQKDFREGAFIPSGRWGYSNANASSLWTLAAQ